MKSGKVIISLVMIAISIYFVVWSVSNLQNHQDEFDEKLNASQKEVEDASMNLLNVCSNAVSIEDLESCKNGAIPDLIELCNDGQNSNLPVCSDIRLKEFSSTVDKKIESSRSNIENASENLDIAYLNLIELCSPETYTNSDPNLDSSCKNSMLHIKSECMKEEMNNIPSCNDPRIEMILDREYKNPLPLVSSENISDIANQGMLDFMEECATFTTDSLLKRCVIGAKQFLDACSFDASVPACNDPRLKEIAEAGEEIMIEESSAPVEESPETVSVEIPKGTSSPGCEASNACYLPASVTINVGDRVEWKNIDTAAHTVTGGSQADGPSGVFDSSLVMGGASFSHTFDEAGIYDYYCMVHPWMIGSITVR